jgi:NAD(P)-dependent dehydrogenase (short-subunit alcohol dehydrogenase family)
MSFWDASLRGSATHTRGVYYQRPPAPGAEGDFLVVADAVTGDRARAVEATWHAHPNATGCAIGAAPGYAVYAACKAGINNLTRTLALEFAEHGIRVNTINPGPVANDFQTTFEEQITKQSAKDANAIFDSLIPLGRHIPMTDIAYGMLYLAGPHSTNVTSTIFRIDGGMGG